jgi:hypothetical protein
MGALRRGDCFSDGFLDRFSDRSQDRRSDRCFGLPCAPPLRFFALSLSALS